MQLGTGFSNVQGALSGGFKAVDISGQELTILNVSTADSKSSGAPMLTLFMDIKTGEFAGAQAKHPLRYYLPYGDEKGLKKLKGTMGLLIDENKSMFPEEDPFATGEFDETRLIGCQVGSALEYNAEGFLNVKWLTTSEEARKNDHAIVRPERKEGAKPSSGGGDTGGKTWSFGDKK